MSKPSPDPEALRGALAAYPTGVTVVTAMGSAGPSGLTANAVTSLSLDPPLMLACLDRGSRTLASVRSSGRFAVNGLAAGLSELATRFGSKDPEPEQWRGVEWTEHQGVPRIEGCLFWIACELRDLIDGGDHLIVTGNVLEAEAINAHPLLFHRGAYRDLLAES
ncbi:MAG: flavin reductase [Solirubrobacterales bacterium]|nr:flavin reductase [Solirubrobacterales bacterium]